jgi:glucose/arabinose dehydrogenase
MSGVAIDPDYANNRFIYVYSASSMTAPGQQSRLRLTVSPDLTSVSNRQDIVTDIAYKPAKSDHPFGDPGAHNGGRLRFSPADGFLYVTTGRHPQRRGAAEPNAHRWQGAPHRSGRQGSARQQCASRASTRGSSPMGTAIRRASASGRHQPGVHGRKRAVA